MLAPLKHLAQLIQKKNQIEAEIAHLIGRPAQIGHTGEYIASVIFDIQLAPSASHKAVDGLFRSGSLANRTVNIKWYGKQDFMLDITPNALPDYYLVMTGPVSIEASSKGTTRPWVIDTVFLFDAKEIARQLTIRKVSMGAATSIPRRWWEGAEIFPVNTCKEYRLSQAQMAMLALFSSKAAASSPSTGK